MIEKTSLNAGSFAAFALLLAGILLSLLLLCGPVRAHGDEHHAEEKPSHATIGPRTESHSELFELVALPSARNGGTLTVYLHDYPTNTPVTDASMALTAGDTTSAAVPIDGTYRFEAPWVLKPGRHDLTFAIEAGARSDLLIGTLEIPEQPPAEAPHDTIWDHVWPASWNVAGLSAWVPAAALALAGVMSLAAVRLTSLLRATLFTLAALLSLSSLAIAATLVSARSRTVSQANPAAAVLDLPATSRRLDDGAIFVPKPTQRLLGVLTSPAASSQTIAKSVRLVGQVIPDPNRSGLVQALLAGRIEPPATGFPAIGQTVKKGDVLGYLVPRVEVVDRSDIRQTEADLDRQIELARTRLDRLRPLGGGAVPQAQVNDARIEYEALIKRRAAIQPVLLDKEILIAPADGVLAQMNVAAGQVVEAQAVLFQIVDPEHLWVEALAFDTSLATRIEKSGREASARTAEGREVALIFAGRAIALRQQAVPLRFRVKTGAGTLNVGEPVTVEAQIDETLASIPVPRSSVVRGANGQNLIFVHTDAERFEPRVVQLAAIDAERVGVTLGLKPGSRIVVRGAELINQVR